MEFTQEYLISTEKQVWVEKAEICVCPYKPEWKKLVPQVRAHWFYDNEKVPGAGVSKEGHPDSLLEHERTLLYCFFFKRCNQTVLPIANSFDKIDLIY